MPALFVAFLAATVAIHPTFNSFDSQSVAMAALPLAFAAAAQAVVVISGGIDLSIGSVMAVANVLAASTMRDASFAQSLFLAIVVLVAGAAIGAVNGLMVIVSRVPDVIVTLTTGFIWGGVALLILEKPGGGAPPEFLNLGTGTLVTEWLSNSLILLIVALAAIWIPVRISKSGLRIYATGSDEIAAFRSGVNVKLARLSAYVLSGLFSAIGGMGLTMTTGIGSPRAGVLYTLSGLGRGRHRRGEPHRRAGRDRGTGHRRVRAHAHSSRPDLFEHRPEFRPGDPRNADCPRGHGGRPDCFDEERQMSAPPASAQSGRIESRSILDWFQRNNVVALVLLLLLFVVAVELLKPGTVNSVWLSNTLLFAAPLGILAAGQTMVMLTGGIDLSVVSVAMGSAFLMTTTALKFGTSRPLRSGSVLGCLWERSMASASLCSAFSRS